MNSNINFETITFTNSGYLDFTFNLLNSIKINELNIDVSVHCTDLKSFKSVTTAGYNAKLLETDKKVSKKKLSWEAANIDFGNMMLKKFEAIHNSLGKNKFVLYTDGDVVFKKNFSDYLLNEIESNDFLFQLDYNPKRIIQNELCAGFMFIKSSTETLNLFDPKKLDIQYLINLPSHDQTYLNQQKEKFKYKFLPEARFPNGAFYYNFICNPDVIHFNYVIGKNKKKTMKRYGEWYL